MSLTPADTEAGDSSPEGKREAEENLARRTSPTGTLSDFLKEYKIPKKYTPGSDSEEGELSDPYEEENRDRSDGNVSDQGQSPPHTRVSDSDEEGPSRFDPLGDTKKFSLDKEQRKICSEILQPSCNRRCNPIGSVEGRTHSGEHVSLPPRGR